MSKCEANDPKELVSDLCNQFSSVLRVAQLRMSHSEDGSIFPVIFKTERFVKTSLEEAKLWKRETM